VDNDSDQVSVFEGFFSFLSYLTLQANDPILTNFLVLNSLSFLEKARSLMERHREIHLFLDNDPAGRRSTLKVLQWGNRLTDKGHLYAPFKDLNDYLRYHEETPTKTFSG